MLCFTNRQHMLGIGKKIREKKMEKNMKKNNRYQDYFQATQGANIYVCTCCVLSNDPIELGACKYGYAESPDLYFEQTD